MAVGGEDKSKNMFETRKSICAMLLRNMAFWSSTYGTIPLRYGGLSMDSHLPLVLLKLWQAPVFSCLCLCSTEQYFELNKALKKPQLPEKKRSK
jgi:hypothetical protein